MLPAFWLIVQLHSRSMFDRFRRSRESDRWSEYGSKSYCFVTGAIEDVSDSVSGREKDIWLLSVP